MQKSEKILELTTLIKVVNSKEDLTKRQLIL